ncbi:SIR2 family protein [Cellulomonas fimi]|uniref:SIR2 family protein n=1 Tax=Cellulomonas fimi TaxID=1708 RepID=A0A7Y0LXX1_CELFI|nr:SIR2 family protein [Cellulomonas fimi]NMR20277.1 SIR2 family protein [Cellulomonas fimi]
MTRGHVFVVRGRLEEIGWDVAVVPTDASFTVERHWWALWGGGDPAGVRPPDWGRQGAAPAVGRDDVWFLDVVEGDVPDVGRSLGRLLRAIDSAKPEPRNRRVRPLIAMPVLGSAGGGFNHVRGQLLEEILDVTDHAVDHLGIDVAIVALNASAFAALQAMRRTRGFRGLDDERLAVARQLGGVARAGELALFLGAGVSMSAGLPSWGELIRRLAPDDTPLDDLGLLDQAELLRRRWESREGRLGEEVVDVMDAGEPPALAHALLAGLDTREIITTNFDDLFERAVRSVSGDDDAIAVLPWMRPRADRPWILKMHGDVRRPQSIVLSRRDFVRYDAMWRPVGSVVQTLMLSRHLLVVGASLTDDNLLRLAHEVIDFRRMNQLDTPIGTVLTLGIKAAQAELWEGELDHVSVSDVVVPPRGADGRDAASDQTVRDLAIFLDALGMYASSDVSYLLDARYAAMLGGEDAREAAALARELHRAADALDDGGADDPWGALARALRAFGADVAQ